MRTTGLVLFLPFDEGSGSTCHDRSGQGNNGTAGGGTSWVTGLWGPYALQFDGGASTVVTVPYSSSLAITSQATFELWVKFLSLATWRNIANKWASGYNPDISIALDGNEYPCAVMTIGGTQYFCGQASPAPSLNTWYHYATTYDGSNLRFYLNGQQTGTVVSVSGAIQDRGSPVLIGQSAGGGNPVNAAIDNVAIYNRALSPNEILADYSFPPMIATLGTASLIIEKVTDDFVVVGSDYNVWSGGKAGMKSSRFNIVRTWQLDCIESNTSWVSGTVQYLKNQAASGAKLEFYAMQGNTFYADAQVVVDDVTTMIDLTSVTTNLRHFTVKIHESL